MQWPWTIAQERALYPQVSTLVSNFCPLSEHCMQNLTEISDTVCFALLYQVMLLFFTYCLWQIYALESEPWQQGKMAGSEDTKDREVR